YDWSACVLTVHDWSEIISSFEQAAATKSRPTVLIARTEKGKGVSFVEGKPGWHGKAMKKDEADRAIAELEAQLLPESGDKIAIPMPPKAVPEPKPGTMPAPQHKLGEMIATREAYGAAIAALCNVDPRVVVLDGDVKNSTFSEKFEAVHGERFYQFFIAEQVMIGASMGLASRGAIPFPSPFAAFFTRAADFIRMAAISGVNVKLAGSHAGVSIGEGGPSQSAVGALPLFRGPPQCRV